MGGITRLSVSFPEEIYEKLVAIATKQHRPVGSVVVEACDYWLQEKPMHDKLALVRASPEYQEILNKLREDLGLPETQQ